MEEPAQKEPVAARPAPNLAPVTARPEVSIADVHRPAAPQARVDDASRGVHEAPKEDMADKAGSDAETNKPAAARGKAKKPPKTHQPGVGGAIFATVIIVLGLAGLAVYAYIKSQSI